MKEAPGKCGGSFLETMVRISYIFIFFYHILGVFIICSSFINFA